MFEIEVDTNKLLSKKEEETLARLAKGLTYQAIADETSRSEETVKTHAKAIREKFNANNIVQAIGIAAANGLLVFKNKRGLFSVLMVLSSSFGHEDSKMVHHARRPQVSISRASDAA